MTASEKELDRLMRLIGIKLGFYGESEVINPKARQAILDWHNKALDSQAAKHAAELSTLDQEIMSLKASINKGLVEAKRDEIEQMGKVIFDMRDLKDIEKTWYGHLNKRISQLEASLNQKEQADE